MAETKPTSIAFLGTGLMGAPMVRNLLAGGHGVSVWNRTRAKAEPLAQEGAIVHDTPTLAVKGASLVITMVSDGPAVADLLFEQNVAEALNEEATVVDMSSIKPSEAREHAARLGAMNIAYLDAPVSGGTKGAEQASLAIMVGGDQVLFAAIKLVLEAMGHPIRVGEIGAGQLSKLANQAIVGVTIGVVAEAMLLAKAGGADPVAVREALKGGFADSLILQLHGQRMTEGNFRPGGLSKTQLKDMENIAAEAHACGIELPLATRVRDRYRHLVDEMGFGELDHSALYLELKKRNGLDQTS